MSVLEGVLAIHKPPSISSFDVIRTVTPKFRESQLFAPLIQRSRANQQSSGSAAKSKFRSKLAELKIGHGGTLDPLATGVLVIGVGNGTKSLQGFLDGTKEYECTILFGAATDSYDVLGKVTKRADFGHITKEKVEAALDGLRGEQNQLPPVYSSIRVDGKHLYEYAREGLEMPEIKRRKVTVHNLELVGWKEPNEHEFELPKEDADADAKIVAERAAWPKSLMKANAAKRKASVEAEEPVKKVAKTEPEAAAEAEAGAEKTAPVEATAEDQPKPTTLEESSRAAASPRSPAVTLRMTVSSGFYVRSLCHDLGVALDSAAVMAALVRTRQSNFKVGENVIEYDQFEQGEEVWGPQVEGRLKEWQKDRPAEEGGGGKGARRGQRGGGGGGHFKKRQNDWKVGKGNQRRRNSSSAEPEPKKQERRRNSSSPESG